MAKSRILVVEDDKASRLAMMALLRMTGFDPQPAGTVAEGLNALQSGLPDCMILDLMLPDGNGGSILTHVRQNGLNVRIAVTTGAMDWQDMLKSSPQPPDAVFSKPIDFHKLITWLHENCPQCA